MTNTLLAISLMALLMTTFSQISFASATSCRGECTEPTLGVADNGRRMIQGGLVINGTSFNVEMYAQKIPTQVFKIGDDVIIKLTAYENSGITNLSHIAFAISDFKNNKDHKDIATISLDNPFGKNMTKNIEANGLLDKINLTPKVIDSFTGSLTIDFVVEKPLDTSAIMVTMWNAHRTSSVNVFENALKFEETAKSGETNKMSSSPATNTKVVDVKTDEQQKLKEEKNQKLSSKHMMKSKGKPQKYKHP